MKLSISHCLFAAALASALPSAVPSALSQARRGAEQDSAREYPFELRYVDALYGHLMEGFYKEPVGVSFDPAARELYVADMKNALIGIYDEEGTPLFTFGGRKVLSDPKRVVVDATGAIHVLDATQLQVKSFSFRGERTGERSFEYPASEGREAGRARVNDFTIGPRGRWYVADQDVPQVLVYEEDMRYAFSLPRPDDVGSFQSVTGVAVSKDGLIAVLDYKDTPVQIFAADGRFLSGFGERDIGLDNFSVPIAAAFDEQGFLYVVDMLRHDVKIFDVDGTFVGRFGGWYSPESRGRGPGEFLYPMDIAVVPDGRIWIAERFGQRVQAFERIPKAEAGRRRRGGR